MNVNNNHKQHLGFKHLSDSECKHMVLKTSNKYIQQ